MMSPFHPPHLPPTACLQIFSALNPLSRRLCMILVLININAEHYITKSQPSYSQNRYICRRFIFVIIILVIMAVSPQNQPYQSPIPEEITLMAFAPNNGTSPVSDTLCQELKECGSNSAAVETTQLNAGSTITNCKNHGIKPFLHVAGMEDSVATCKPYVDRYKIAAGLGGWMLKSGVTQTQASAGSSLSKAAGL